MFSFEFYGIFKNTFFAAKNNKNLRTLGWHKRTKWNLNWKNNYKNNRIKKKQKTFDKFSWKPENFLENQKKPSA